MNNNFITSELKQEFNNRIKELHFIESGFYKLLDDDVRSDSIVQLNERLVLARQQFKEVIDSIDYELSTIEEEALMTPLMSELETVEVAKNELMVEYFYGQEYLHFVIRQNPTSGIYKVPIDSAFDKRLLTLIKTIANQPEMEVFDQVQVEFAKNAHFIYSKLARTSH